MGKLVGCPSCVKEEEMFGIMRGSSASQPRKKTDMEILEEDWKKVENDFGKASGAYRTQAVVEKEPEVKEEKPKIVTQSLNDTAVAVKVASPMITAVSAVVMGCALGSAGPTMTLSGPHGRIFILSLSLFLLSMVAMVWAVSTCHKYDLQGLNAKKDEKKEGSK